MDVKDVKDTSKKAYDEAKAKSKKAVEDAKAVIEKLKGNENVDDLRKNLKKGLEIAKKNVNDVREKTDLDEKLLAGYKKLIKLGGDRIEELEKKIKAKKAAEEAVEVEAEVVEEAEADAEAE